MIKRKLLPLLLVLALPTACERPAAPPAPPEVPDAPAPPPAPVAGNAAPAAPSLPSAFVVSTNEPFWSARVDARLVVLNGPDVSDRRFTIASDEVSPDQRVVHARDASDGMIEVRIRDGSCEDSMSGAVFPFGGTLVIDGASAASGCARPADMAPPPVPAG